MNVACQFPRYPQQADADPGAEAFQFQQVRDFLGRQWRLIALVTVLAIIVGIAYLALTPSRYTAPVLRWLITLPSASIWLLSVTTSAE